VLPHPQESLLPEWRIIDAEGREVMTHADLVKLGLRWLSRRCSVVFAEFATAGTWETPDVIGWRSASTLIECKVSRSDFSADAKKPPRLYPEFGMGRYRYFLCPAGIISADELPDRWGLLWVKDGRVYLQRSAAQFPEIADYAEVKFLVSMLRRAQVRLGDKPLSDWLRIENMYTRGDVDETQSSAVNHRDV
jgi:hypothetical protein